MKHNGRTIQFELKLEPGKPGKIKYTTQQLFDKPCVKKESHIILRKDWKEDDKSKYLYRRAFAHEEDHTIEQLGGKDATICESDTFMENTDIIDYFEALSKKRPEISVAIIEKINLIANKTAFFF